MPLAIWSTKRFFKRHEFFCKHCLALNPPVENEQMDESFVFRLDELRAALGFSLIISSGYRCPQHPVEVKKKRPGTHTLGLTADIGIYGERAFELVSVAMRLGFRGIGIYQQGSTATRGRHVHLDIFTGDEFAPRPRIWSGEGD